MKEVTLKIYDLRDWQIIHDLLRRLHIVFEEKDFPKTASTAFKTDEEEINALVGSWESEESSDEIIERIYGARVNQTNLVEL
jgi:hypothetical protein